MSCTKAQEFLAAQGIEVLERIDARKIRLGKSEVLSLMSSLDTILSIKGKISTTIDIRTHLPNEDTISSLLLGPSGNLRAPSLRIRRRLIVGFERNIYLQEMKS